MNHDIQPEPSTSPAPSSIHGDGTVMKASPRYPIENITVYSAPILLSIIIFLDNVPKYMTVGRPALLGEQSQDFDFQLSKWATIVGASFILIMVMIAVIKQLKSRKVTIRFSAIVLFLMSLLLTYVFGLTGGNQKALLLGVISISPFLLVSSLPKPPTFKWIFSPIWVLILLSWVLWVVQPSVTFSPGRFSDEPDRFAGVFSHSNVLAIFAAVSVIASFLFRSFTWLAVCLVSALTLLLTYSRTSILALLITGAIAALVCAMYYNRILPRSISIAAVMAAIVGSIVIPMYVGTASSSLSGRPAIWEFIQLRWRESPWIGHGTNGLAETILVDSSLPIYAGHAHNIGLHLLFNYGLFGLVAFTLLLISLTRSFSKRVSGINTFVPFGMLLLVLSTSLTEVLYLPFTTAETALLFVTTFLFSTLAGIRNQPSI